MYMTCVPLTPFQKAISASLNPECLAASISRFLSVSSSDGGLDEVRTQITKARIDISTEENSRFMGASFGTESNTAGWSRRAIKPESEAIGPIVCRTLRSDTQSDPRTLAA